MKREILKRSLSLVLAFGLAFSSGGNIVFAQTIQEPEIIITDRSLIRRLAGYIV